MNANQITVILIFRKKRIKLICMKYCLIYIKFVLQFGRTPLHYAVKNGHLNTVSMLLIYGSDINMKNKVYSFIIDFVFYNT